MQAGAAAFMDKPFSDEQLLKNIQSAFRLNGSGGN
jgi:FixJ family two-component response regulator